jgi:hypothetical protein
MPSSDHADIGVVGPAAIGSSLVRSSASHAYRFIDEDHDLLRAPGSRSPAPARRLRVR